MGSSVCFKELNAKYLKFSTDNLANFGIISVLSHLYQGEYRLKFCAAKIFCDSAQNMTHWSHGEIVENSDLSNSIQLERVDF